MHPTLPTSFPSKSKIMPMSKEKRILYSGRIRFSYNVYLFVRNSLSVIAWEQYVS